MENDIIFSITIEDIQKEAVEKINRNLSEEEIEIAKNGLEWGLLTDIETIYNTIFREMI